MGIRQVVVVSDLHCGCRMGLCPPAGQVSLDEGGGYTPSKLQQKVWAYWEEFWGEWVPRVTRGEPWALVVNGDGIEGVHHGQNTNASNNITDQIRIAKTVLQPQVKKAVALFYVRGTEVHVGKGGEDEETLAELLGARPDSAGRFSRFELRLQLDRALVDFQHHIATVGSNSYETTALQKEFVIACEEAGRWGQEAPDVIVRSHRHRYSRTTVPTRHGEGTVVTTPGWQLKTPLTYRMPGARQSTPQFGGVLVRCGDEDIFVRSFVKTIQRAPIETIDIPEVTNV